jgi:hypothetical protein
MPYTGTGLLGLGGNLHFDGTNFHTLTDGVHNGGSAFLTDYSSGTTWIYSIPTNKPATGQTISPATLQTFAVVKITPKAVTIIPLAGSGNAMACLDASGNLYRGTSTTCP